MTAKTLLRRARRMLATGEVEWVKNAWAEDHGATIEPVESAMESPDISEGSYDRLASSDNRLRLVMISDGKVIPVTSTERVTKVCELGALFVAAGEKDVADEVTAEAARVLARATLLRNEGARSLLEERYEEYVEDRRDYGYGDNIVTFDDYVDDFAQDFMDVIPEFNDGTAQTVEEIIAIYDRALKDLS